MRKTFFLKSFLVIAALGAATFGVSALRSSGGLVSAQTGITPGALQVIDPNGKPKALCPLKHTEVKAQISGFLSRVVVTQEFENPFKEKIEAVYTFPLPQNAAVDDMTILPGEQIKITLSYVETLKYDEGSYEFVFPMVVGPRYVPGSPTGSQGKGFA